MSDRTPAAPGVSLRDHERRAVEMIAGITDKIRRLEKARADRVSALQRIRANLALGQAGTAQRED